jgi:hypothetical protein
LRTTSSRQAGAALALAGMKDSQIGDAATLVDVPKSTKRLGWIEKRVGVIDSELAGVHLAANRHAGELEQVLAEARLDAGAAQDVQEANVADLDELQDLEARIAAVSGAYPEP